MVFGRVLQVQLLRALLCCRVRLYAKHGCFHTPGLISTNFPPEDSRSTGFLDDSSIMAGFTPPLKVQDLQKEAKHTLSMNKTL